MLECIRRADGRFAILHGMVRDTLFVVDIGGGKEVRSRLCGYLERAHLRLKKSQWGDPEGSKLMKPTQQGGWCC